MKCTLNALCLICRNSWIGSPVRLYFITLREFTSISRASRYVAPKVNLNQPLMDFLHILAYSALENNLDSPLKEFVAPACMENFQICRFAYVFTNLIDVEEILLRHRRLKSKFSYFLFKHPNILRRLERMDHK